MLPLLLVISIGTFIPLRLLKNLYLARMRIQDPPQEPFFSCHSVLASVGSKTATIVSERFLPNIFGNSILNLFFLAMFVPGLPGFEPELLHQEANLFVYVQVLHDLIHIIVLVLLEPGVANLPEGGQLIRALNVLTVKIVERSDHTAVSLALLRLLQVPVPCGSAVTFLQCCVSASIIIRIRDPKNVHMDPDPRG